VKRRNIAIIAAVVIVVFFIGGGIFVYARYFGPQTVLQTDSDNEHCRQGNVLDGVVRPSRLTVLSNCEKAIGIVHDMTGIKADDGDYEFNLDVEQPYKKLLNAENDKQWHGMLHVEIIPIDQNSSSVEIPKNGDKIEVYGAWVADRAYLGLPFLAGWNEIHPAWTIRILRQ
jgi:hypothetical protein